MGKKVKKTDNNNLYERLENAARETGWHLWMTETVRALRHADIYRFGTWAELERLSKNIPAMQWLIARLDSFHINPSPVSPEEAALYILACYCPDNKVLGYVVDTFMYYCKVQDSRGMLSCARIHAAIDREDEYPHLNVLYNLMAGVAETLETEFAARMEEKRLEFKVNNAADEVVMGDRNLILRIGSNLLSNALKFTERGGVTLTALYAGGKFTLAVEDTGGGIDKDKREQIFKPFERLSNAATQDGFGLGLSIVKSLAELMEGSISVENIRNTGSRFSVVLPLPQAEKAVETGRKAAARRTRLGGCSVLSLDNDGIILGMIHDIFVQNGVHCDTCTSTGEMAEKLREGHYDLLTTDLKMQDASGYEVLELLRTSDIGNSRTIPVMVVTGSKSITKEELAGAGFGSVLYKPFSIDELLAAAEECIGEDSTPRIDLGPLFAYGDKRQRLECLVRETEKEMAAIREEAERCDRDRLDYWIHHIRSSWMLIHAEGPLQELYDVLHGNGTAEEIREYARKVTGQGETIIRFARKEMEKTVWEE